MPTKRAQHDSEKIRRFSQIVFLDNEMLSLVLLNAHR
jgi:hypothetical protein